MQQAMKPLDRLAAVEQEKFKEARSGYEVNAKVSKLLREANFKEAAKLLKDNRNADISHLVGEKEPPEPTLKRYIVNDTNVASLGEVLRQNPNGVLVFRDEIVSLLDDLDREENASDRGFYLTGWNGDSAYTFDRIGRGLNLHIEGVCVSLLGSAQPGRIAEYLATAIRGGRGDDGLIQRFSLLVWPDISPVWTNVDRPPDKTARNAAFAVFNDFDALDWRAIGAQRDRGQGGDEEGVPYLRFGIDAYDGFLEWRTALELRLRSGEMHPALESHLAKYRKLVPGLALICHLADGGKGPVAVDSVRRAIAWADYLETHARRAYSSGPTAAVATAKAIIAKIQSGALKPEFSAKDVWRPGWSKLNDRETVMTGLTMLVDFDWLDLRKAETRGRSALVYYINPKVLKK
jgi:putative DNA primase/helicase